MCRMPTTGVRLAIQGFDPHLPHQATNAPAPDGLSLITEQVAQHPAPGKRKIEMQFVHPAHQCKIRDLGRMSVVLLCQFGQCLVALQGGDRHLGFQFWRVILPLPCRLALAPSLGRYAATGWARLSLISLSDFPGAALMEQLRALAQSSTWHSRPFCSEDFEHLLRRTRAVSLGHLPVFG